LICYLLNNNTLLLLLLLLPAIDATVSMVLVVLVLVVLVLVVLGDLDLDSSSPPADAMQNFCDSRFYPTARSPTEGSRRAEFIAHFFAVQRSFSTLISWSGSSSMLSPYSTRPLCRSAD
jgi:hypothetical protein